MEKEKLYVAYGSNLHAEQMNFRCHGAEVVGKGIIRDYALVYRGSKTGAHATIIPCEGDYVPVAIWKINDEHEVMLDIYEGYPRYYYKKDVEVEMDNGETCRAMVYIMFDEAQPGCPSDRYLEICSQGYLDQDLDMTKFEESIVRNRKEMAARRLYFAHI